MSQPTTTSAPEAFHPHALATIAALAAGRGTSDDQPAWHERALCAQTDPEAFFPENGASTREAKQICSRCPVRAECLEHALRHDERFGVWGATSETERRVMRRARPAAPTASAVSVLSAVSAVPEQRTNRGRDRRESAPTPGRRAGSGVAGTLPTEPRGRRDQPTRPASTFPARARSAPEPSSPAPAPATRRPATRGSDRETRPRPAAGATRAKRTTPPLSTGTERTSDRTNPATGTATAVETDIGAASNDEVAAAEPEAPPDSSPNPSGSEPRSPGWPAGPGPGLARRAAHRRRRRGGQAPPRELHDVAELVLAGQHMARGSDTGRRPHSDLDAVDLDRVLALVAALTDGSPVAPAPRTGRGLWERRIAAVTTVLSGTLTRGKTARAMGERSQVVAHWVAAHQAGMALLRGDEQRPGGDDTAQGGALTPRPGTGER